MSYTASTAGMTPAQYARRIRLDPDIPELAKKNLGIIFALCRQFLRDSQRQYLFDPSIDYWDILQELMVTFTLTDDRVKESVIRKYDPSLCPPDFDPNKHFAAFAFLVLKRRLYRYAEEMRWGVDAQGNVNKPERQRRVSYHLQSLQDWMTTDDLLKVDALEKRDSLQAVIQFVHKLTERQQLVFNLAYSEELSGREIATELGLNYRLVYRDIAAIRRLYTSCAIEDDLQLPAQWVDATVTSASKVEEE